MTGIGLIIFGAFVALLGYVLIVCVFKDRRQSPNRTVAEITKITPIENQNSSTDFFRIVVKYLNKTDTIISSFTTHSLGNYRIGSHIGISFNPDKPSQIISTNENTQLSPVFIVITVLGTGILLTGIVLAWLGI